MSQYNKVLSGAGGGSSKTKTPTSTPDSLRSQDTIEIIMGLSEGPIFGPRNGNKDLFLGTTAVQRADGQDNFQDVKINLFPGEPSPEAVVFALGGASNNRTVNVPLAYNTPIVRQTINGEADFIQLRLNVQALYKQVNGGKYPGVFTDAFQFRVRYKPVDAGPNDWAVWTDGSLITSPENPYFIRSGHSLVFDLMRYEQQLDWAAANSVGGIQGDGIITIQGKTTSTYVKEYKIPVERTENGYLIEVTQLSADSDDAGQTADGTYHINSVLWESYQEIDASPKTYPNTAILQMIGKATDQFTSIPQISGIYRGLIVRVPNNYDPEERTYSGVWDGTWKYAWTNNPVWLLYEAVTNDRWGWSAYSPISWSQWEAYELAQICDFKLTNPQGVQVPRYTFNASINDPMDGREFCRYIAGSFNSTIIDDNNGNIHVLMDKNDPAVGIVGTESLAGSGKFTYTYTDVNTRYNDITAVFLNPDLQYAQDRRRIKNDEEIEKFGRITYDFVAVGCTNEWEAVRKATRRLVQAVTETEMVNFRTNRLAQTWAPYDIILIADSNKGQGLSGRLKGFDTDLYGAYGANIRDAIYFETGVTYKALIQGRDSVIERTITNPGGASYTYLTFDDPVTGSEIDFIEDEWFINEKAQFSIVQDGGSYGVPKPYRILSIENGDGDDDYTISAIEVNRLKYDAEDTATIVGEPTYTFVKSFNPEWPTNINAVNVSRLGVDGTFYPEARIDFTQPEDDNYITQYQVRYRLSTENEWTLTSVNASGETITVPLPGTYYFEVRTMNVWQQASAWRPAEGPIDVVKPNEILGGTIASVTGGLNQITIKVVYPNQGDIRYAHIYGSTSNTIGTAQFIGKTDSTTYIHTGLSGTQTWYYWLKFEDNQTNVGTYVSSTGQMGTTTQAASVDIADAAISITKFASGIEPVGLVSSLPPVSGYTGPKTVFYNDQLYTYSTSGWEAVGGEVAAGSIDITKFASGIRPVEIVSALPSTGNIEGRIVYLTTDDKIYRYTGGAWTTATAAVDITGQITGSQIADAAISVAKFASGIAPVEIVATLPSTGNYEGRQVYLTTDDKMYRYTGSAWTTAIAAVDISGQVSSSQIADSAITIAKMASTLKPVEIVSTLPSSGNVEGRMVYLTTDDKLYRYTGSAWISTTAAADITGQITSSQITDGAVSIAKIASGYTMPQVVSKANINDGTVTGATGALAYNTTDGVLYRNNNGTATGWVSMVQPASTISGQLNDSQLASISAAKLTGQITSTQITDGSISTPKLAAGAVTAATIAANTITAAQIAADTITATQIAANAITSSELASNSVIAGKIAAGVITAAEIAVGTITADKLFIGSNDNLIPNPNSELAYTSGYGSAALFNAGTGNAYNGAWVRRIVTTSAAEINHVLCYVPCAPGDRFYAEAWVKAISGTPNMGIYYGFQTAAGGGLVGTSVTGTSSSSSSWTKVAVSATAPADAAFYLCYIYQNNAAGTGYFDGLYARKMLTGSLIVDGTITAANIAADTITATQIAANAITSSELASGSVIAGKIAAGVITATEIASNAITAAKLAVSSFDNLIRDGDFASGDLSGYSRQIIPAGSSILYQSNSGVGWPATRAILLNRGATAGELSIVADRTSFDDTAALDGIPCAPNDEFYFEAYGWQNGVAGSLSIDVVCRYSPSAIFQLTPTALSNTSVTGSYLTLTPVNAFAKMTGYFKNTTSNTGKAYFRINYAGANATGGYLWKIIVRRRNAGELIVDGTITGTKLVAQTITATQIATDTITSTQIAANAITASELAANSVIAGKIAAGVITATEIAANAITASKLALVPDNLIGDPYISDMSFGWWNTSNTGGSNAIAFSQATPGWFAENSTSYLASGSNTYAALWSGQSGFVATTQYSLNSDVQGNKRVRVQPARVYEVSAWINNNSNQTAQFVIDFIDNAFSTVLSSPNVIVAIGNNGIVRFQATAPANAVYARVRLANIGGSSFSGSIVATAFRVNEANSATMIVDGTITGTKIAAVTITAANIAADTITATQIAANAITSSELSADSVIAGKIAAAAVNAREIAAGAITATKLAVGNFDNIITDGQMNDLSWWQGGGGSYISGTYFTDAPTDGNWPISNRWMRIRGGSSFDAYSNFFAVEPGASYKISVRIWNNATWSGWFQPLIHEPGIKWYSLKHNTTVTPSATDSANAINAQGDTGNLTWTYTMASTTNKIQFRFLGNFTSSDDIILQIKIVRMSDTTLITDGAVTTDKITANAITAGKIAAGAVSTTQLAAGAVTADKIAVTSLSAVTATIGVLRTATTGARMEIRDNVIKVYDSAGTLRVQFGDLSL